MLTAADFYDAAALHVDDDLIVQNEKGYAHKLWGVALE